jgi:RecA-family ATPase
MADQPFDDPQDQPDDDRDWFDKIFDEPAANEPEPKPNGEGNPEPPATVAIPFVMTWAMKARLAELGYDQEQIRNTTPQRAWSIINTATANEPHDDPIAIPEITIPVPMHERGVSDDPTLIAKGFAQQSGRGLRVESAEPGTPPPAAQPQATEESADTRERRILYDAIASARRVVDKNETGEDPEDRVRVLRMQMAELADVARKLRFPVPSALLMFRQRLLAPGDFSVIVDEHSPKWLIAEVDEAIKREAAKDAGRRPEQEFDRRREPPDPEPQQPPEYQSNGQGPPDPPPDANYEPPRLLRVVSSADWQDKPVPPRRWLVHNRIPMRAVTILAGDGGKGKTTIGLQLCYAVRRGTDWLSAVIDEGGPSLFFTAEETHDEVHRRLEPIHNHFGTQFRDVPIDVISTLPDDAEDQRRQDPRLGVVDRKSDRVVSTQTFEQLCARMREIGGKLVMIESLADVFAVNELDRQQARGSIAIARHMALTCDCAVVLLAHSSRSGNKDGSATSGSTQWRNAVRSFLSLGPTQENAGEDDASHQLTVHKANYGPTGEVVRLVWDKGVYKPQGTASTVEVAAAQQPIDDAFLACLEAVNAQGLAVSMQGGSNYAPTVFQGMTEARGYKTPAFKLAMDRLRVANRIRMEPYKVDGHTRKRLVRS